ncbi:MAG: ABC transporter ATP-binding protein [Elusimicrobia bacterium]|nr:ABC transporter ATP-binding protein [Elusimicrobiota bacterium]
MRIANKESRLKGLMAAAIAATLIILSPGLGFYEASAAMLKGRFAAGAKPLRLGLRRLPGREALSVSRPPSAASGNPVMVGGAASILPKIEREEPVVPTQDLASRLSERVGMLAGRESDGHTEVLDSVYLGSRPRERSQIELPGKSGTPAPALSAASSSRAGRFETSLRGAGAFAAMAPLAVSPALPEGLISWISQAWPFVAPALGAAVGIWLSSFDPLKTWIRTPRFQLRHTALITASLGLLAAAMTVSGPLGWAAAPAAGLTVVAGVYPLWSMGNEAVRVIKARAAWFRKFWKGVDSAGIKVKGDFRVAAGLALFMVGMKFLEVYIYGKAFKLFVTSLPAVRLNEPAAWHNMLEPLFQVPVVSQFVLLISSWIAVQAMESWTYKFYSRRMFTIGNKIMTGLNHQFIKHVMMLPMQWHNKNSVGTVVSTATDAIYQAQKISTDMIITMVRSGPMVLGSLAGMLWIAWWMSAWVVPAFGILLSIPVVLYSHKTQEVYREFFSRAKPRLAGGIKEIKDAVETIKASGREEQEIERVSRMGHDAYMVKGGEIARVTAPAYALESFVPRFADFTLLMASGYFFVIRWIELETATIFYNLSRYFRDHMQNLIGLYLKVSQMIGTADRYDKVMDSVTENLNLSGHKLASTGLGWSARLDGVTFGYKNDEPVLHDVSLDIERGKRVAFVGTSGSGKSTVARLLLGLHKTQRGKVLIEGRDLDSLSLLHLRQRTGTILQNPIPFGMSIAENIAWLDPGASEESIWSAAAKVGLHDDIALIGFRRSLSLEKDARPDEVELMSEIKRGIMALRMRLEGPEAALELRENKTILENLPPRGSSVYAQAPEWEALEKNIIRLGYRTQVDERGTNLSGGQVQRLLLSRFFINPQVPWDMLILDEPTAALDSTNQAIFQRAIDEIRGKTTVIMIAHRLSTVQDADKIVVFHQGRIMEQGFHAELMAKEEGVYRKLWEKQRLDEELGGR